MKRLAGAFLAVLLAASPAPAQLSGRLYTTPVPPSEAALNRLNLETGWRTYLPVDGRRDGIFTVQMVDNRLYVQTIAGLIVALDAEKGTMLWRTQVGLPYRENLPLGFNRRWVLATRGDRLFAIDRATGRVDWDFVMPDGPTAPPAADDEGLYLTLGLGRIYAYLLPDVEEYRRQRAAVARQKARNPEEAFPGGTSFLSLYGMSSGIGLEKLAALGRELGPQPEPAWEFVFEAGRLYYAPLQTGDALLYAATNGYLFSVSKFVKGERFRFQLGGPVGAALGQYGDLAYIGSEDFSLYALDMISGRMRWRFVAGAPIVRKPAVTDRDVYVVARRRGLYCVDRLTGRQRWHNREAQRFLAVNTRFVYAFDIHNRLLVLDRFRGTRLGLMYTRDFPFPVPNEQTDRLYLAAHNGLLVCLHDRDQREPLVNRSPQTRKRIGGFREEATVPPEKQNGRRARDEDKDKGNGNKGDKGDKD